jgi:hypothetical protein
MICSKKQTNFLIDFYNQHKSTNKDLPFIGSISTNSGAAALSGALLATEAALIITKKRKKEDMVIVPYVTSIDLFARSLNIFNPLS